MQKWKLALVFVLVGIIAGNFLFWVVIYTSDVKGNYDLGYVQGREVGYNEGNETGYQSGNNSGYSLGFSEGYVEGVIDGAGTGYNIRDPTYEEMVNFIATDKTDENE
jgi:hypothetical protein